MPPVEIISEAVVAYGADLSPWRRQIVALYDRWAGKQLLDDFAPDHLEQFAAWCAEQRRTATKKRPATPWSTYTIAHAVHEAARFLAWLRERGLVDSAIVFRRPRLDPTGYEPRDLSPEQLAGILAQLDHPKRRNVAPLLKFVVLTGCRPGEARLLRWEQVRLGQSIAILDEHKTRRQSRRVKTRTIYLGPEALALLRGIADPSPGGWVFPSRLGRPYTRDGLRAICTRLGFYPYQLRHTFAQGMIDQGTSTDDVARLLGHRSVQTTAIYSQVRDQRALAALTSHESPVQRALAAQSPPPTAGRISASDPETQKPRRAARRRGGRRPPTPRKSASA
jgi:integrase